MGTKKKAHPTKYQGIFRYLPRGTLYARFKVAGKQLRQRLKTSDLELARARLAERQFLARTNARRLQKDTRSAASETPAAYKSGRLRLLHG